MDDLGLQLQIIVEVAIAMLLGGLVGFERELADKPAGLRTHMITAGAAALLVGLSHVLVSTFATGVQAIEADPIRVVQAIIIGISFIGAGTIFRGDQRHIEGLTTAASLLISAGIGIAAALQQYAVALAVAVMSLVVLRVMKILGDRISGRARE